MKIKAIPNCLWNVLYEFYNSRNICNVLVMQQFIFNNFFNDLKKYTLFDSNIYI